MNSEKKKIPFARRAAIASLLMPVISKGISIGLDPSGGSSVKGNFIISMILISFYPLGVLLAITALLGVRKHGKKGIFGLAIGGLVLNGLILLLVILLIGPMKKVKDFYGPYTKEQLEVMPEIIPGSIKVINPELGFRIEIPPGFERNFQEQPQQEQLRPIHLVDSYLKRYDDNTILMINIECLNGIIGKERLSNNDFEKMRHMLPANATIETRTESWGKYDIGVLRMQYPVGDEVVVVFSSQVPLVQRAIQIEIGGSPAREYEMYQTLKRVLDGLRGKSNWDFYTKDEDVLGGN